MQDIQFTLDALVRLTGFSKRQIRYYITEGLVPGAGENRGPYAVYPPETLARLKRIAELKSRRVPPTGRRLTLREIAHELDAVREMPEIQFLREPEPSAARRYAPEGIRVPRRPDPMRALLRDLAEQLLRLGQAPATDPQDAAGRLLRIEATDDLPIEINIRHPDHDAARERLEELAVSLFVILDREES